MARFFCHQEVEEIIFRAYTRASIDTVFQALCVSDPLAAAKQEARVAIPADFRVRVVENAGADLAVVLSETVVSGATELSDADLEAVADGDR